MAYPQVGSSPGDVPPASLVRAELDRILASELFTRSERLSAFLKFIVDQTLAGHGDSLKEQVIAVELYGKSADFDTAADPIVRVDARRLRDKLRDGSPARNRHLGPERQLRAAVPRQRRRFHSRATSNPSEHPASRCRRRRRAAAKAG